MKQPSILVALALSFAALGASAQSSTKEAKFYNTLDRSADVFGIKEQSPLSQWKEATPPVALKRYSTVKYGLFSEVQGGFTSKEECVVTATAMMLPRRGKYFFINNPIKEAGTFGALSGATREQCKDLALAKRKEAIQAVMSALDK